MRKNTKMMLSERVGLIVLIAAIVIFAMLALMRGCQRGDGAAADPVATSFEVDSLQLMQDSIKAKEKRDKKRSKGKSSSKKSAPPADFSRSHLDEGV